MSRPLPTRYEHHPAELFAAAIRASLRPDMAILDVGSGRRPALAIASRPAGSRYVGLDLSAGELELAPQRAYDERVVADISTPVDELRDRFDLIVSWQVLEHVRDTQRALEHARSYLLPGGRLVAVLSGRYSVFGRLNTALPAGMGVWLMRHLLRRDPQSVFPAHYDRCSASELTHVMSAWTAAEITPLYLGASYFNFSMALRDVYLAYESRVFRAGRADLATHYLINASR